MHCAKKRVGDVKSSMEFTINGVPYTVDGDILPGTSLNVFIRDHAKLRGTKAMCHEGGCGACVVSVTVKGVTMSVNSCLVPVLICNGWAIKTIEGIGNKRTGYHVLQASLAEKNGSQCGYCSPGMVMNMYSLLQDKKLTMKEIENSFGSNICRCTGYRPILDTFKGFAVDATAELAKNIRDIEELYKMKICKKTGAPCQNGYNGCSRVQQATDKEIDMKVGDSTFHKVLSVDSLFEVFQRNPNSSYVLHGGNTAHGVYRLKVPDMYIDINDIPDLRHISKTDDSLTIGGNLSLTAVMETFNQYSKEPNFEYLKHLADHIDLIASVPVRNVGTLAGNLMIKHQYHEFPSDLFLMLETAGAQLHIVEAGGKKTIMNYLDFLEMDMKHKIIYSTVLPALGSEYKYRSFKIMPRAQNAHAHVNAGFLLKLDGTGKVLEKPNIIFGGIHKDFLHATETENFLIGKSVFNRDVVKQAIKKLDSELNPEHVLPDYSPQFRKTLAEGLFYKFIVGLKPENVDPKLRSAGPLLERGLSSGKQDYNTDKNLWPLTQPLPKIESAYQTSGEAQYVNDIPPIPNEVFCAFVLSTVPNGKVGSIDSSEALKMKGVVAFFSARDIPGKNLFISKDSKEPMLFSDEVLFADEKVEFAGQPVGIIVATSQRIANEAAEKVRVSYVDVRQDKAVFSIEQVLASNDDTRIMQTATHAAKSKGNDTKHVIKGVFRTGGQYHYTMEPQSCVCVPIEDGLDVYPATQWIDLAQTAISECLDVPSNSININVRRLGGGYGGKLSRTTQVVCACALVSYKLNRPARLIMSIESNMKAIGKRFDTRQEYEVGVDDNGRIQYLNSKSWGNAGSSFNEPHAFLTLEHMESGYDTSTWTCYGYEARTDLPSNTYCRAPSSTEGVGMIENIMEHIARVVGKDPVEVRLLNMDPDQKTVLQPMIEELSRSADYDARKRAVETFNNENRWKKKGIALVPMLYPFMFWGQFHAHVAIYAHDGTVSVTHGGVECGQGINTKVAQMAAHTLGIDLSLVTVKPNNNLTAPNNSVTGGSVTSDACSYATMVACQELLRRLEPVKQELKDPTWQQLVSTAHQKDVDLCARYLSTAKTEDIRSYGIYGVTIAEVEVDVLTGQHIVQRVDIMEDAGVSMNPEIDLGQIEGAFVMGLGYWTMEDLIYDPKTGQLTNYRTWNYKTPGAKDIPVDFRVYFRRDAPNPSSVLRSKATGEPPLCMSCVIPIAIRNALNSARKDAGNTDVWYQLDGPVTTEKILLNSLTTKDQMSI
nr:xanthine dehydrogenase 1-like isoform X1 [Nomia melanderi]XP_031846556.1 xanthine dehydrogenase 1-like isoform X1 [Nomia melanderi]XP_031846557.1 xanthine dehydrogenase 1-like isoform X1 [Nomia melanderi]XP_031846559.1 xanthine dehydrogenase 1-like isoform X1 [Nomia melanderi]XP_031846560.1 xanthine dehydrogenase 1-like isoform X1 [Nomia melanderi]